MMRGGLVALHWGWLLVILQRPCPIDIYPTYKMFLVLATAPHWQAMSFGVALLSSVGWSERRFIVHEVSLGVQAVWLLLLTTLFATDHPTTTGLPCYGVLASFATFAAIECALRHRITRALAEAPHA